MGLGLGFGVGLGFVLRARHLVSVHRDHFARAAAAVGMQVEDLLS